MSDFTKLINNIPDYQVFLTVDEMDANSRKLAEEYSDVVEVFEAGKSRKGHPILCLKIGNGPRNALMFGCPHPNEPMGAMMLEYFSKALAEDEKLREDLGYTWYLIKSIDIYGTKGEVYAASAGKVVAHSTSNKGANGRYVIIEHNLNGKIIVVEVEQISSPSTNTIS